ncbi:MAG: ribosomal protein L7/L12 [Dermatophilaceae bacterium]
MPDADPGDQIPNEPGLAGSPSARGLRGWLQRRAESALRRPGRASPEFTEPGEYHVVLQLVGAKPVQVMTVIAQVTGLDLISARDMTQDTPVVLVSGVSEASADRAVSRLQKAGARAVVGEQYQPDRG